jgi:RNA polymerase sigma factor (TIGR02999 family)
MSQPDPPDLTQLLLDLRSESGRNPAAAGRVFELVYGELRRAAGTLMRRERPNHTLQPTALVNEAYLRLVDGTRLEWQNRAHFFGIAARAMRQILVDHARERAAEKRGGGWERVTLDERLDVMSHREIDLFELDDALSRLGEMDERMARIVELRFFAGLTAEEVAHVLEISRRTVQREWRVAKMWLARELGGGGES